MSKIHIPTPLRQYVGKQVSVEVQGATVGEAMNSLVAQHPDLRKHLYTEEGKLRAFVNLYVNDEDIRYLHQEATALKEGDNISIVPSIAGGAFNGSVGITAVCRPERSEGFRFLPAVLETLAQTKTQVPRSAPDDKVFKVKGRDVLSKPQTA